MNVFSPKVSIPLVYLVLAFLAGGQSVWRFSACCCTGVNEANQRQLQAAAASSAQPFVLEVPLAIWPSSGVNETAREHLPSNLNPGGR